MPVASPFLCFSDPSASPNNVTATAISSTDIRVHWSEVNTIDRNGVITYYEVEYNQTTFSDDTIHATILVDSLTFMVEVTDLEEYVEYFVRVRAYTSVGAGPYSDTVMERTEQDGNKCMIRICCTLIPSHSFVYIVPASPPYNLRAVNISSTTILVVWDEIPAIDLNGIVVYEVEYNQSTFSSVTTSAVRYVSSPTLMVELTGLEEYVEYSIRVRGSTSLGGGPYSVVVVVITNEDGKS